MFYSQLHEKEMLSDRISQQRRNLDLYFGCFSAIQFANFSLNAVHASVTFCIIFPKGIFLFHLLMHFFSFIILRACVFLHARALLGD